MNPLAYPSTERDWEARRQGDFSINPNLRKLPSDYPINEDDSPIKVANFNVCRWWHDPVCRALPTVPPFRFQGQDSGWCRRRLADRLRNAATLLRRERPHDRRRGGWPGTRPTHATMRTGCRHYRWARQGRGSPKASTRWAGTGGHRIPRSSPRIMTAAPNVSIWALVARDARKGQRAVPMSPTGRMRFAPGSSFERAAGCAKSPWAMTAWRPALSITMPMATNRKFRRMWLWSPVTASARRACC